MMHPVYAKAGQRLDAEAETAAERVLQVLRFGPGDYPEDFKNENGMYLHRCPDCKKEFVGDKGRVVCKICRAHDEDIALQSGEVPEPDPEALTPAQEIAASAAPYMPPDKFVELVDALVKALPEVRA